MAQLIDSSVFIALERGLISYDAVTERIGDEDAALAAVTASELLAGVYRADSDERRRWREAFVEQVLRSLPVIPFDLLVARVYARIADEVRRSGFTVGAHDLQIAATALSSGSSILTYNLRDFGRVAGVVARGLEPQGK